ncbi:MAG: DUF1501 domain-containing protein [Planctomycetota bacterium]
MLIRKNDDDEKSGSENRLSRRRLLELSGYGAAALASAPAANAMRVFSGAGRGNDYKALVCVFLYGGADTFNVLVPTSTAEYDVYAASRGDLAEAQGSLLPITPLTPDGATYGVHGQMPAVQQMFQDGKLAFVPNTGPLVRPLSKTEFLSGTAPIPPYLFSHNDQQTQWQVAQADGPRNTGWAGRMLDLMPGASGGSNLSPGIGIDLTAQLLVGTQTVPYVLGVDGTESLGIAADPVRRTVVEAMMQSTHALGSEFARVQRESIEIDDLLSQVLANAPDFSALFPQPSFLAAQLQMVARMISVHAALGVTRQVFFVGTGGWDTHDAQTAQLPGLLGSLSSALGGFQAAMEQIGEESNVTSFTHTEFGRTLSSNGQGSDHGWGGHALAFGGAVRGQDIYGAMPNLQINGPDDIGEGRIMPRIGVDQFASTLAKWFGLAPAEVNQVFPNVQNFATSDLGFLA